MSEPEKLDLRSMDIAKEQKEKLRQLFPEVFTEDNIDFDKLKLTLGESIEIGKERYGMNWPGKADCFKIIQNPSIGTLKPCPNESVNFDNTENLFIEGDNLEVLKLLQKSYYGKVKMIYIDPPYNTGNDFIYPDDYKENLTTYLQYTGQVDVEGKKFSTNTDTEGRFHSKWLNMMYPRLFFAKNLLAEDGIIFVSIDDSEIQNLRFIMNEIFGEENDIGITVRVSNSAKNNVNQISVTHEYCLVYAKYKDKASREWAVPKNNVKEFEAYGKRLKKQGLSNEEIENELKVLTKYPRFYDFDHYYYCDNSGVYRTDNPGGVKNGNMNIEIMHPITTKPCKKPDGGWRYKDDKIKEMLANNMWHFGDDEKTIPAPKRYLKDYLSQKPSGIHFFDSQTDAKSLKAKGIPFDFPKPVEYIKYLLRMEGFQEGIVLDFFAGSCTTAHALLDLNREDGGKRKFILVQLPETCEETSSAYRAGFKTIAEIGKERIRNVIKNVEKQTNETLFKDKKLDLGFKVFKLDKSNFKIWDAEKVSPDKQTLEKQLELHIDHIDPKATQEDILFEILLKAGFELTTKIEKLVLSPSRILRVNSAEGLVLNGNEGTKLAGKTVYSIEDGTMLVCLEKELTKEVIKAMAERSPSRVICLDQGFANNDQLKTNAVQIMKSKGVDDFRTV